MNGDKMVKTDIQHRNRDEESNNTGLGKKYSANSQEQK
jgi:hypothetical protein